MSKLETRVTTQAIIKNEKGERLLIRFTKPPKLYNYPGGHLEENESWQDALQREVKEETGLSVTADSIQRIFQIIWKDFPLLGIVATVKETFMSDTAVTLSHEHDAYKWFSIAEITESNEVDEYLKADI